MVWTLEWPKALHSGLVYGLAWRLAYVTGLPMASPMVSHLGLPTALLTGWPMVSHLGLPTGFRLAWPMGWLTV
jgi:hypothetical protein